MPVKIDVNNTKIIYKSDVGLFLTSNPNVENIIIEIKDNMSKTLIIFKFFFCSAIKFEQIIKEIAAIKGGKNKEKEDIIFDQPKSIAHWLRKIVIKERTIPSKIEVKT